MAIEFGNDFLEIIKTKDAPTALLKVQQYKDKMKDVAVGAEFVVWITEPANLTNVHKALIEYMNISPRLLAIKRINSTRTLKAVMLVQAMENAIKKTYSL